MSLLNCKLAGNFCFSAKAVILSLMILVRQQPRHLPHPSQMTSLRGAGTAPNLEKDLFFLQHVNKHYLELFSHYSIVIEIWDLVLKSGSNLEICWNNTRRNINCDFELAGNKNIMYKNNIDHIYYFIIFSSIILIILYLNNVRSLLEPGVFVRGVFVVAVQRQLPCEIICEVVARIHIKYPEALKSPDKNIRRYSTSTFRLIHFSINGTLTFSHTLNGSATQASSCFLHLCICAVPFVFVYNYSW